MASKRMQDACGGSAQDPSINNLEDQTIRRLSLPVLCAPKNSAAGGEILSGRILDFEQGTKKESSAFLCRLVQDD